MTLLRRPASGVYSGRIGSSAIRLALVLGASVLAACGTTGPAVEGLPARVDYNFHVKAILSDRCFACHGPDDNVRKAGLRLDTADGPFVRLPSGRHAVVAGSPRRSELVRRILADDPAVVMPTPESHLSLNDYEKAVLIRWIEQGAEWKPHWSFTPAVRADVPAAPDGALVRNPIDRFVLARLADRGLQPSAEAPKETLIRRASLALTGLPPALEDIDAFLADTSSDAYERVVDRLLASDAYGERMASEWLDVARYADSHGYQDDGMRAMWPWRDWVIGAFNRNMPIDEFITWQLAGDLLPNPTREQRLATAFNRHHMQSQEGGIVPEEYRVEYVADRVNTTGTALLAIGLECARCHDHKYDPIQQREYFQLFAFFNNNNEAGQIPYSGVPSPTLMLPDEEAVAALAAIEREKAELERATAVDNPAFDAGLAAWLKRRPSDTAPAGLVAHLPLDGLEVFQAPAQGRTPSRQRRRTPNTVRTSQPAVLQGDQDRIPETVDGHIGRAQRLVGDSHLELPGDVASFDRDVPFSISLWVRVDKAGASGPIFSRSSGIMNGNRGYGLVLTPTGTLSAWLAHVMPDNAIEIETAAPLTVGQWTHLVMSYDGSSRVSGLRVFIDGEAAPARPVVDNLHRSIRRSGIAGNQNWGTFRSFTIGGLGDETLQDVSVDELRIFETQLTTFEVRSLYGTPTPLADAVAKRETTSADSAALRDHYVRRIDQDYRRAFRALTEVRGRENHVATSQPEVMVMRERAEPRPTFMLARGAYDAPTERVEPGTPAALGAFPDDLPRNRLGLARWLTSGDHPLTARVIVNRYWALVFGRGIVPTVNDFGSQGRLPSHPELLDWLAVTFVESGWDLKALHKMMVTSATFRQSSSVDSAAREADPENEWLARGPAYRLSAEQIRDAALASSGLLVRTVGGPSVYPYQPPGLWEELATRNATTYTQGSGDDLYRRSLYTVWKRSTPPPSAISFDAGERLVCTVARQRTSTPLQALILMNDPQYVESARVLAEQVVREGGASPDERVTYAFRRVLSRAPSAAERQHLVDLYAASRARMADAPASARALSSVGERRHDATIDPVEAAAWTVVANTILNLDEAVYTR